MVEEGKTTRQVTSQTDSSEMIDLTLILTDDKIDLLPSALAAARGHFGVTTNREAIAAVRAWYKEHPPSKERIAAVSDAVGSDRGRNDAMVACMAHFLWEITSKTLHAEGTSFSGDSRRRGFYERRIEPHWIALSPMVVHVKKTHR